MMEEKASGKLRSSPRLLPVDWQEDSGFNFFSWMLGTVTEFLKDKRSGFSTGLERVFSLGRIVKNGSTGPK
jgi:hypothetical protein